jgi:hypothetical protein
VENKDGTHCCAPFSFSGKTTERVRRISWMFLKHKHEFITNECISSSTGGWLNANRYRLLLGYHETKPGASSCEHSNETSGSRKCGEFFD